MFSPSIKWWRVQTDSILSGARVYFSDTFFFHNNGDSEDIFQ